MQPTVMIFPRKEESGWKIIWIQRKTEQKNEEKLKFLFVPLQNLLTNFYGKLSWTKVKWSVFIIKIMHV